MGFHTVCEKATEESETTELFFDDRDGHLRVWADGVELSAANPRRQPTHAAANPRRQPTHAAANAQLCQSFRRVAVGVFLVILIFWHDLVSQLSAIALGPSRVVPQIFLLSEFVPQLDTYDGSIGMHNL